MLWSICRGMPTNAFSSVIPFTPPIASLPFSPPSQCLSLSLSHPFLSPAYAHKCFLIRLQPSALRDWHKERWTQWNQLLISSPLAETTRLMLWCVILGFVEPSLLQWCPSFCATLLWSIYLSLLSSQPHSALRHGWSHDSLSHLHTVMASASYIFPCNQCNSCSEWNDSCLFIHDFFYLLFFAISFLMQPENPKGYNL